MYEATAAGTKLSSRSPREARARISVDETSGVWASTAMIRGGEESASSEGEIMRSTSEGTRARTAAREIPGLVMTTKCAASRMSGKRYQLAISANASAPVMKKICEGLRPSACRAVSVSQVYDG